jgi:hypothetical protein
MEETCLCGNRDAQKVDEADILVTDDFDLINKPEPTEVVTELFLGGTII